MCLIKFTTKPKNVSFTNAKKFIAKDLVFKTAQAVGKDDDLFLKLGREYAVIHNYKNTNPQKIIESQIETFGTNNLGSNVEDAIRWFYHDNGISQGLNQGMKLKQIR